MSLIFPGLVKEISEHKKENASNFLAPRGTYVLVEKRNNPTCEVDASTPRSPSCTFSPLLQKPEELFPNFKLRVPEVIEEKKSKPKLGKSGAKWTKLKGRLASQKGKMLTVEEN